MPTWRFPERNGGIDYVNDPSSAHFSDAPISKLVRELIQNALDAKNDGFTSPVSVTFSETSVGRELIGATTLQEHLDECRRRLRTEMPDMAEAYENALSVVEQRKIPCLKVQDTGTVGLNEARWKALVMQEGAVSKGGGAPGGSYGIGKNATLNVSDLLTVFYSTRLVDGRRGLVTKLQGKATLIGHRAPDSSQRKDMKHNDSSQRKDLQHKDAQRKDLQHIGFYCAENGEPITGKDIPEFFQLKETGTGIFIMGFNPHTSEWGEEVVAAVIENFFYAIHHKELVVTVAPENQSQIKIDHQTIDSLFKRLSPTDSCAAHYYKAIRDVANDQSYTAGTSHTTASCVHTTARIGELGALNLYAAFAEGSPRRTAHINRNGMLITDSRELKVNPLAPRGRSLWPDYVCVVVPGTDKGDRWLRKMENPSHDAISLGHLRHKKDQDKAVTWFRAARKEFRGFIDAQVDIDGYGNVSNVDELADVLPDQGDSTGSRTLTTRTVKVNALISSSPPPPPEFGCY